MCVCIMVSDASRARDTQFFASFSTNPQFGTFGAFGRRRDPACLQNGGVPIVLWKYVDFFIFLKGYIWSFSQ